MDRSVILALRLFLVNWNSPCFFSFFCLAWSVALSLNMLGVACLEGVQGRHLPPLPAADYPGHQVVAPFRENLRPLHCRGAVFLSAHLDHRVCFAGAADARALAPQAAGPQHHQLDVHGQPTGEPSRRFSVPYQGHGRPWD